MIPSGTSAPPVDRRIQPRRPRRHLDPDEPDRARPGSAWQQSVQRGEQLTPAGPDVDHVEPRRAARVRVDPLDQPEQGAGEQRRRVHAGPEVVGRTAPRRRVKKPSGPYSAAAIAGRHPVSFVTCRQSGRWSCSHALVTGVLHRRILAVDRYPLTRTGSCYERSVRARRVPPGRRGRSAPAGSVPCSAPRCSAAGHHVVAAAGRLGRLPGPGRPPAARRPRSCPADEVARAAADLLLLAVPDDVLGAVVAGLAATGALRPGQMVAHTSGAHGLAVLGDVPRAWPCTRR